MQRPSAAAPAKKFVLRPFKQAPVLDAAQAVEMWQHLRQAIVKIQERSIQHLSFEELYRFVRSPICLLSWMRGCPLSQPLASGRRQRACRV
jgi:hypothetical protein